MAARGSEGLSDSVTPTTSRPYTGQEQFYKVALWLAFVLCIAQAISLPLLVTTDGYWYAKLAEVFGTARFAAEWDYLRTPLFPILLKLSFWLFGRQPLAVCALQSAFGFGGIWLLGATLRRLGRPVEAAIVVLLLSFFPTLVTYEHALLTEVGTFFFLALLLYVLTAPGSHPYRRVAELVGVLTLGYYHRSSLLYISPAVALVYAISSFNERKADQEPQGRTNRRIFGEVIIVLVLPLLLAYPWQHDPRVTARTGQVFLYGLAKQAVIPPEDPIWANATAVYRDALDKSMVQGRLPNSGVRDQLVYLPLDLIHAYAPQAGSIFMRSILRYPRRYADGFMRTSLLFAEIGSSQSDSAAFRRMVLLVVGTIAPRPPGLPPLDIEMAQHVGPSFIADVLTWISPVYDRLVFFAVPATLMVFAIAIWRKDAFGLAFATIPLAFLLLNALVLSSQDRMAAPAYPILLVNLVSLAGWLWAEPLRIDSSFSSVLLHGRAGRVGLSLIILVFLYPLSLHLAEKYSSSMRQPARLSQVRVENLNGRKRLKQVLLGNVDRVDEGAPQNGRGVLTLAGKSEIEVEGWAIDQIRGSVGQMMVITVNQLTIGCEYGEPRLDVAAVLHNSAYTNSGYVCHVPLNLVKAGENTLQPVLITMDDSYYTAAPIIAAVAR
jgi:Dolichyl-phosphate-mannose-protein mannosyltransferase